MMVLYFSLSLNRHQQHRTLRIQKGTERLREKKKYTQNSYKIACISVCCVSRVCVNWSLCCRCFFSRLLFSFPILRVHKRSSIVQFFFFFFCCCSSVLFIPLIQFPLSLCWCATCKVSCFRESLVQYTNAETEKRS